MAAPQAGVPPGNRSGALHAHAAPAFGAVPH
jgi:hypothetical protein